MRVVNVLLSGFAGTTAGYDGLRRAIEQVSGRRTILINPLRWRRMIVRGHGNKYPPALFRQANYARMVIRQEGLDRVNLIGVSMGAAEAMILAHAFPEEIRVEKLTLVCPATVWVPGVVRLTNRMRRKGKIDQQAALHHPDPQMRLLIRAGLSTGTRYVPNLSRVAREGWALARVPLFAQLYPSLSARMPIFVVFAWGDQVFDAAGILAATSHLPPGRVFALPRGMLHDAHHMPELTARTLWEHGAL